MRLQTLLRRIKAQRATMIARQARGATREFLFPELGVTRLEERRLLNAAPVVMPDSKAAVGNQTPAVDKPDGGQANGSHASETAKDFLNNGPTNGLVTLSHEGSFESKSHNNSKGAGSFNSDGKLNSQIVLVPLNVPGVDSPPVNTLPGSYSTNEDTPKVLTGISVADPDSDPSPIHTQFQVNSGTLTVDPSVAGVTVLGNGTNILQIVGTQEQINATLALPTALTYTPGLNFNGVDQLKMVTNDLGATGSGGPLTDTDFAAINVAAVDDPPVNTLPSSYSTNEDTPKVLTGISVADPDSDPSPIHTQFQVSNGTLTVDPSVAGVTVLGNGTNILQIVGTQEQINATLALPTALTYTPSLNYNGVDQLKMVTNDLGATGSGGPLTDTDFATISVAAVDDPPVNTLPSSYSTNEDTPKVLTGISVADPDSDPSPIHTQFQVSNGTLTVDPSVAGVIVIGNGTNTLQIVGTQEQINATLALPTGLTYTPGLNYNGVDQLKMVTNDLGATGSGGPLTDTDFATISVAAVDDPPVNTLPSSFSTNEDTPKVLTGISVADPDSDPSPIHTQFQVTNGTLTVDPSIAGVIVIGNGTNILQIVGTQEQINATLALPTGLTYTPGLNYNGVDQLKMVTNDLGATGSGGPLTDTDFATISVAAVDDPPVNTLPSSYSTNEDTPKVLTGISVADPDSDPSPIHTQFQVSNGTLTVDPSVAGVIVIGNGTNTLQIVGTQEQINATLALPTGLTYTPGLNYNGVDQLKMVTNDLGATGSGGPLTDTDFATISVAAVDDPPVNTLPSSYSTNEDTAKVLTGISVADPDSDPSPIHTQFQVSNGTLTVDPSVAGVIVIGNGTNTLQIVGTQEQINATLALPTALTYTPGLNYNGVDQLKMVTNDLGATGSGGPLTDTDFATISVAAVDDPPVNTLPSSFSTNEDTSKVLTGISVADPDSDPSPIHTQFQVSNGTLTVDPSVAGVIVIGNGTNTLQIVGTQEQINATLALPTALTYTPGLNYNGVDQLKMVTNDLGATGSGGPLTDTDFATISVAAVDDPPVNTLPSSYTTNENTPKVLTGISVADPDSDPSPIHTQFQVTDGTLTVDPSVAGIIVLGNGTNTLQIIGTQEQINATLALPTGLTYSPTLGFTGPEQLKMVTNDLGATGAGGPLTDTDFATITVGSPDQPPVNTLPISYSTNEDTPKVLTGISVADPDSDPSPIHTQFEVQHGTLTVDPSVAGVIVLGNGTNILQIIGTQEQINATLALPTGLTYTPGLNYNGVDQLKMVTNDLGATGFGGPLTDTDFAAINIAPVDDPPVNSLPAGPYVTNEDTTLVITGVSVSDVDSDPSPIHTQFQVTNGTLNVDPSVPGVIVLGNGTNILQIIGTQEQINATLALPTGLSFHPTANYGGPATLTMITNDLGATGAGGPLTDTDVRAIYVTPVADAPNLFVTSPATGFEGSPTPLSISGSLNDLDGSESLSFIISNVPTSAILVDGLNVVHTGASSYTFSSLAQVTGMTIQMADDSNFTLTVTAKSTEQLNGDTATTSLPLQVIILNVPPTITSLSITPNSLNEGQSATLTGTYSDPGVLDTFVLLINWGDGTTQQVVPLTPSGINASGQIVGSFTVTHLYADDNPTGTHQDLNTVHVTVRDDDGGEGSKDTAIEVIDVDPVLVNFHGTDVSSFGNVTLTGTAFDVGVQDTLTLFINWGDGSGTQAIAVPHGAFAIVHHFSAPPDPANPTAPITIHVTLADDDLGTTNAQTVAAVPGLGNSIFFIASLYYQAPPVLDTGGQKFDMVALPPIVLQQSNLPFEMRSVRGGQLKVGDTGVLLIPVDAVTGKESLKEGDRVLLPVTVLDRLPDLFDKLPDGQYHLYYVELGNQRLIMDVVVRGGRPIDPNDDSEGTQDRPPTAREVDKLHGGTAAEDAPLKDDSKPTNNGPTDLQLPPDGGATPNGAFFQPPPLPGQTPVELAEELAVASLTNGMDGTVPRQNPLPESNPQAKAAATVIMMNESDDAAGRAESAWRRPSLAPAVMAVASAAIWTNGRWARQVDADLTQASADSLSKAARLRRRLRRAGDK